MRCVALVLLLANTLAAPAAASAPAAAWGADVGVVALEDEPVASDVGEAWRRVLVTVTNHGPNEARFAPWEGPHFLSVRLEGHAGARTLLNVTSGTLAVGETRTYAAEWEATGAVGGLRLVAQVEMDGDRNRSDNVLAKPWGEGPAGVDALGVHPLRSNATATRASRDVCVFAFASGCIGATSWEVAASAERNASDPHAEASFRCIGKNCHHPRAEAAGGAREDRPWARACLRLHPLALNTTSCHGIGG